MARYLDQCRHRAFARGAHDCVFFVAGAINAQCLTDLGEELHGRAHTVYGVSRLIYDLCDGKVCLETLFDRFIGIENRVPLAYACRGFPLVCQWQGAPTAGILGPGRQMLLAGANGLVEQPLTNATVWRLN